MRVYYPNGERFLTFDELKDLQERETARASTAETRASAAETRASAAETLLAAEQERTQRLSRLVELLGKAAAGPLSPKEQEELAGLRSPGSATSASGYVVVHHVVMANRHL